MTAITKSIFITIPTIGPNDADVKLQSTLNCPSGHVFTSVAAKANCVERSNNPAAEGIDNKAFLIIFLNPTIIFFICQVGKVGSKKFNPQESTDKIYNEKCKENNDNSNNGKSDS